MKLGVSVFVNEPAAAERGGERRQIAVIRTTIDDMNPELYGHLQTALLEAGEKERAKKAFLEALKLDANSPEALYRLALSLGGTITGEHGIGATRRQYLPLALEEAQIDVMRRIRAAFARGCPMTAKSLQHKIDAAGNPLGGVGVGNGSASGPSHTVEVQYVSLHPEQLIPVRLGEQISYD